MTGIKYDDEKLEWDMVPWEAMEPVVRVLMFGAKKYEPNNWKFVEPKNRYTNATFRHLIDYTKGEQLDPETGESHLAHAICCLLFKLWDDLK